jgi:hypothetical protein
LLCARQQATFLLNDPASAVHDKIVAENSLNSNSFLWMGVMTHDCSCPEYWLYGVCKHALWATMISTGQIPPSNLTRVRLPAVAERGVHVGLGMDSSLCQTVRSQQFDLVALLARDV